MRDRAWFTSRLLLVEAGTLFGIWLLIDRFLSYDSWRSALVGAAVYTLITAPLFTWLAVRARKRGDGRSTFRGEWAVERYSADGWSALACAFGVFAGLAAASLSVPPVRPIDIAGVVMFAALTGVCVVQAVRARRRART